MDIEGFTASNGWMARFRVCHGISYRQVNGEAASVNPAVIENWVALLPSIVNVYAPRYVYNTNELGLCGCTRYNHEVPEFERGVVPWQEDRKLLLFLDNFSAHPKNTFLRNLKVVFLPANTTSHLQPLDAGIIKNVKHLYRKCIVQRFLARVSDPDPCMTDDDDMNKELRSAGAELAFSDFALWMMTSPTCDPKPLPTSWRNEHDDDEDEPETPPGATFTQAVAALDVLRTCFDTKDNPAAEEGLQALQKELFLPKGHGLHQQKPTDVFGKHLQYRRKLIEQLVGDLRVRPKKRGRTSLSDTEERLDGRQHFIYKPQERASKDCAVCSDRKTKGGKGDSFLLQDLH
ncbi:hypothetical protein HPB47_012566 [Ixodes persulcatus]|uniref:Uncharacterized protein n=1 Tax=Ixodes persulcatus TaxID=34615 RepID=A0AC60NT39_IXOPE|nr:hypothetical protein HPB47_012566 [Ixodes persulcatus]